ncbi:MAG: hypothetical protein QOJ26_1330 [Thermoplasmata archaeon]|jgi:hypothetical protein|nr:hypothetical protein [Thermoplasmata archaeon]MEA3166458.1 hypothetical protein [Thermoplasmata archaeon]
MSKALLAIVALTALAFAGCSGDGDHELEPVTCPDGTVLTAEDLEAFPDHHEAGFNATAHCPVKPSVSLLGVPASIGSFKPGAFSWTLDNGTVPHAHSMLTSIRYSTASIPDSGLTSIKAYPNELIKREHQNLPITYKGNMTFSKVGKVYLRAYMEVSGVDYWSPEVAIDVLPVTPTGKVQEFTIPPGAGVAGDVTPGEAVLVLGDGITVVDNDPDPRGHTCSRKSGPAETDPLVDGNTVVLIVPGTYEYECTTLQPTTFKVIVNV